MMALKTAALLCAIASYASADLSAQEAPPPTSTKNATFTISTHVDIEGKMCLDLFNNGTSVDLEVCEIGKRSQMWIFAEGSYRIASMIDPGQCIDAVDIEDLYTKKCNGLPR